MQIEGSLQHFLGCLKLMRRCFPLADCSEVRRTHFFLLGDSFVTVTRIELLRGHFVTKIGRQKMSFEMMMMRGNFVSEMMTMMRESSVMRMLKFGMGPSFVLRRNSAGRA